MHQPLLFEKPEDRARLLRKENAKALHLIFSGENEWTPKNIDLIERIRQSVDIPIQVSLSTIPEDLSLLKQILNSGIYRLFLPPDTDDNYVCLCINDFSRQKIVASVALENASFGELMHLKEDGLDRVCITLPPEQRGLPLEKLQDCARSGKELKLRLSLLFGVYSYESLIELSKLDPGYDSVILGSALEENAFPCQGIWREMELKASALVGAEANLWKNPLEHVPHL